MNRLDLLLEAERRGILPPDKAALLAEARRRGLVKGAAPAAPPAEEESGFFRQALDLPVKGAQGIATGIRLVTDAFGADNPISQDIRGVESYLQSLLSAQARKDEQEVARIMKEAEDKGVSDQVVAGLRAFQVAPLDTIAQAAGTIAPVLVGGLATAALRLPAVVGTVGIGATMGAGTTKSAIYDATYEVLRENGSSDEEARERAAQAQEYGGKNLDQILIGTVIGGVTGRFGAEDVVARKLAKDITRRSLAKTAGQEAATEFGQAAQEQIAANIAQQREGFEVPTFRGAVGAGTLEALAGAGVGAGVEAIGRPSGEMPTAAGEPEPPAPPVTPTPPVTQAPAAEPQKPAARKEVTPERIKQISDPEEIKTTITRLEDRLATMAEVLATPEKLAEVAAKQKETPERMQQRITSAADAMQTRLGLYKQRLAELAPPAETAAPPAIPQAVQVDQPLAKELNLPQAEGVPATQQVTVQVGPTTPITPFAAQPQQLELPGVPSAAASTTPQVTQPPEPLPVGGGATVPPFGPVAAGPSIEEPAPAGLEPAARPVPDVATGEVGVQPALEAAPSAKKITWDNIKPGQQVTLYRGENAGNQKNGEWWTTDRKQAEKFGDVTEVTLPSEVVGKHSVRGQGGPQEFVFPTEGNRPTELAAELPPIPELREDATDAEVKAYYEAMRARDAAMGVGKPRRRKKIEEETDLQRGEVPLTPQITIDQARSTVDETVRGWTNAPKIVIAQNAEDPSIPEVVRNSITPDTKGTYANGTVYVLADRASNQAGVRGTVFHESLGHFGLRELFGSRLDKVLSDIYNTNPQTKRAADALIQQYPELTPARAVNEVLAQKSEAGPIKEAGLRAAFNRVAAFVRRVGRTVGIRINYSNNDVGQVLAQAHRRVMAGKPSVPGTAKAKNKADRQVLDIPADVVDSRGPLTKPQMQGFKDAYNTVKDILRRPMLGLQSLPELVDLYKNEVPTLQGLLDVVNEKVFSAKERLLGVDRNVRRWADLLKKHPNQIQKFYSIALESTRLQVDFDSADDANHSLTKEFNALPSDLKTVYREMRKWYQDRADEYLKIITKNLPPTVANEFRKQYEAKRLKVYFPLFREGKYWLRYQQGGETVVRAFRSRRARTLAERDAIKEGGKQFQSYEKIEDVLSDPQAGFGFYSKAMEALETHYQNTYGTAAPLILKQNLYEMFLDTIPASSVRQQFRKREGYIGAERDLLGVYATMAPRMMNQLNNLEFNPKLDEAVGLVNEDVEKAESISANDLKQEVQARLDFLRDPTNSQLVNFGVFFSYFDYIIGNISSAVANLTNLPMSVYPVLAGKHGYDKTALAMEDATKMWFKGGWDNDGAEGIPNRWPSDRTAFADLPKNSPLSRLFDRAVRENALKHSVAYDLLEARGQRMELQAGFLSTLKGTNDYMGFWNKTKQGLGWVFQNTERFNREVALIAAFNLEMEKGASEKDAIKYAIDVVNQTNGVTLSEIGPRFFQTGVLKIALTFKNFARTQMYLQYKLLRDMLKGAEIKTEGLSPEEAEKARAINNEFRKIATKQWLGTLAGAFTFAGIQGLPFYGALTVLASLTDDDDEPMDPDERIKQGVGSLAYKGLANQLLMADLASRTGFNGMLWREDPKRVAEVGTLLFTLEQLMGPAYGSIRSRISAYEDWQNGYTDRVLEKTMPLFVRNMLKWYRYATEGVLTKQKDARITEDPTSYELFMQFAGFTPARISEAMARSGARKEIEKKFSQRREALLQNYYNAWVVNDQEGIQDALESIDKHNQSKLARDLNYYITEETILRSRRERLRRANESLEGMSFSRRMARGLEEVIKE